MSHGISEFSNKETTYVYHYGIKRETDGAKLYDTDFGEIWIPKSQILDHNKEIFAIPTWLAKKNGIKTINGDL